MKITRRILSFLLIILTALYPIGTFAASLCGYRLKLLSSVALCVCLAALSICLCVLEFTEKSGDSAAFAIIMPISMINAALIIVREGTAANAVCVAISLICCLLIAIRCTRPRWLKIASLTLSALMTAPLMLSCAVALLASNFGQTNIVKEVASPSGDYRAVVIDSDQGATGGNTFVDLYEDVIFSCGIFELEKKPRRIYSGDWGEGERMDIYWKGDGILVIDDIEYRID